MEVLAEKLVDREGAAHHLSGVIEGRVIEMVPVPYAGDEQATVVIQPPVSKFMVEKPA